MPRVTTSRSQKATRSHSQAKPTQNHADVGDEEETEDEAMQPEATQGNSGGDEYRRKANDLVRLALFTEHKRTPLKREEITKKVIGSQARSFNYIFELAQDILRSTFGMELVELRSRAELVKVANITLNNELDEARQNIGIQKKVAASGSKTYILRSVLDPVIIEYASLTDELILEEEAADAPDDDDDDDLLGFRTYGSIISWSQADQLGHVGLLYVILTLILVSGRVMSDAELRSNLKRLRLPLTSLIVFSRHSTQKSMTVEAYLNQLIRQGYVDRQRAGETKGAGAKRGRAPTATQRDGGEDSGTWEWRWGNRAESEVGEMGIAKFAAAFMVERSADDEMDEEEDEEGGDARNGKGKGKGKAKAKQKEGRAEKKVAALMKAIERAAGGNLAELNGDEGD